MEDKREKRSENVRQIARPIIGGTEKKNGTKVEGSNGRRVGHKKMSSGVFILEKREILRLIVEEGGGEK